MQRRANAVVNTSLRAETDVRFEYETVIREQAQGVRKLGAEKSGFVRATTGNVRRDDPGLRLQEELVAHAGGVACESSGVLLPHVKS